jgi:hypothetical protein
MGNAACSGNKEIILKSFAVTKEAKLNTEPTPPE